MEIQILGTRNFIDVEGGLSQHYVKFYHSLEGRESIKDHILREVCPPGSSVPMDLDELQKWEWFYEIPQPTIRIPVRAIEALYGLGAHI